jgi:hypothetical protein
MFLKASHLPRVDSGVVALQIYRRYVACCQFFNGRALAKSLHLALGEEINA